MERLYLYYSRDNFTSSELKQDLGVGQMPGFKDHVTRCLSLESSFWGTLDTAPFSLCLFLSFCTNDIFSHGHLPQFDFNNCEWYSWSTIKSVELSGLFRSLGG